MHCLDPLRAQLLESAHLGLDVVGFDVEMHPAGVVHLLNFEIQSHGGGAAQPFIELALVAREFPHRQTESAAPESRSARQIVGAAIDDESPQFAFMHCFLQI